jgi:hypothetical protein
LYRIGFELALYATRDHDCISNRIGSVFETVSDAYVGLLRSVRFNAVDDISRDHHAEQSSVLGTCFWPLIIR